MVGAPFLMLEKYATFIHGLANESQEVSMVILFLLQVDINLTEIPRV